MRRILFALALLGPLSAQMLTGVVADETGAAIENAEIAVSRQPSRAIVTRVRTKGDGSFRILDVEAGVYDINISGLGFKSKVVRRILAKAGGETNIGQVKLEVMDIGCHWENLPTLLTENGRDAVASLHGSVFPPPAVATAAVHITLKPLSRHRHSRSTSPENSGKFEFKNLDPGAYKLVASTSKCADFVIDRIEIRSGQNSSILEPLKIIPCKTGKRCLPQKTTPSVALCL